MKKNRKIRIRAVSVPSMEARKVLKNFIGGYFRVILFLAELSHAKLLGKHNKKWICFHELLAVTIYETI
jgi:hypothetical protein